MRAYLVLSMAATAVGFQMPVPPAQSTGLNAFGAKKSGGFDPSVQLGAQAPTGFWDPFGLATDISEEQFARYREVEQKHGRIAMIAVIGYCVPAFIGTFGDTYLSFSEKVKFSDIPNGVQAIFKIPTLGVFQILLLIGILETQFPNVNGDYGTGYFGQFLEEPVKSKKLAIELSNGTFSSLFSFHLLLSF